MYHQYSGVAKKQLVKSVGRKYINWLRQSSTSQRTKASKLHMCQMYKTIGYNNWYKLVSNNSPSHWGVICSSYVHYCSCKGISSMANKGFLILLHCINLFVQVTIFYLYFPIDQIFPASTVYWRVWKFENMNKIFLKMITIFSKLYVKQWQKEAKDPEYDWHKNLTQSMNQITKAVNMSVLSVAWRTWSILINVEYRIIGIQLKITSLVKRCLFRL